MANFLLKITLWGERRLNVNRENIVFLLASCPRIKIIQGVLLLGSSGVAGISEGE